MTYAVEHKSFISDSALLATLPYCTLGYDTLSLLYSDPAARTRWLRRCVGNGLIVEKRVRIASNFRGYYYRYVKLTEAGLRYLVCKYSALYPWLALYPEEVQLVYETRTKFNARTLMRMFRRQTASLFWSMANCETVYERMASDPVSVGQTILSISSGDDWVPRQLGKAMMRTMTQEHEAGNPSVFYDSKEVASIVSRAFPPAIVTAAQSEAPETDREPDNNKSGTDPVNFNANHSGLLVSETGQRYTVFVCDNDGFAWSSHILNSCAQKLRNGFSCIRQGCGGPVPKNGFYGFLLFHDKTELKRAFTNSNRQWAKNTLYLGFGASRLHLLPCTEYGVSLAKTILSYHNYRDAVCNALSTQFANITYDPILAQNTLHVNGEPCIPLFDMDAILLNYVRQQIDSSQNITVICWDWEALYMNILIPEAKLYSITTNTGNPTIQLEHPEARPNSPSNSVLI